MQLLPFAPFKLCSWFDKSLEGETSLAYFRLRLVCIQSLLGWDGAVPCLHLCAFLRLSSLLDDGHGALFLSAWSPQKRYSDVEVSVGFQSMVPLNQSKSSILLGFFHYKPSIISIRKPPCTLHGHEKAHGDTLRLCLTLLSTSIRCLQHPEATDGDGVPLPAVCSMQSRVISIKLKDDKSHIVPLGNNSSRCRSVDGILLI